MKNMLNIFKLYYIGWHQKNDTRDYKEFGNIQGNIGRYEKILKTGNLEEYLSNFEDTMYLELWVDVCEQNKKFFISEISKYTDDIIENVTEILFYISSNSISDYIKYSKLDFVLNKEGQKTVSPVKKYKTCLMILKKLDSVQYDVIEQKVNNALVVKYQDALLIKKMWNTINIKLDGSFSVSSKAVSVFNEIAENNADFIERNKEEVEDFYKLVFHTDENILKKAF